MFGVLSSLWRRIIDKKACHFLTQARDHGGVFVITDSEMFRQMIGVGILQRITLIALIIGAVILIFLS